MNKLKLLDLFSGIGGFSLGLESTGFFETIAFVEKDKFCRKVLKKNFNNIPIEEDIRNVKGSNYAADIITGGFPCQPFSVAGKRKGTDDDRYLWDETIRVVAECKPRWFIGENVEGLININNGMVLRQVQTDLEDQGFQVQCIIVPAAGIGAFHQRKRIWIIGFNATNSNNNGSYRSQRDATKQSCNEQKDRLSFRDDKDVPNSDSKLSNGCGSSTRNSITEQQRLDSNEKKNWNEVRSKAERCSEQDREDVPNTNSERSQRHGVSTNMETEQRQISSKNSIKEQQTWWQTQSEFCGIPNGISATLDKDRSNRIKSLGNSIVPQIARQLGLSIMEAELSG
jgi:DNA (cytosine-5)-methyltransferase 1